MPRAASSPVGPNPRPCALRLQKHTGIGCADQQRRPPLAHRYRRPGGRHHLVAGGRWPHAGDKPGTSCNMQARPPVTHRSPDAWGWIQPSPTATGSAGALAVDHAWTAAMLAKAGQQGVMWPAWWRVLPFARDRASGRGLGRALPGTRRSDRPGAPTPCIDASGDVPVAERRSACMTACMLACKHASRYYEGVPRRCTPNHGEPRHDN